MGSPAGCTAPAGLLLAGLLLQNAQCGCSHLPSPGLSAFRGAEMPPHQWAPRSAPSPARLSTPPRCSAVRSGRRCPTYGKLQGGSETFCPSSEHKLIEKMPQNKPALACMGGVREQRAGRDPRAASPFSPSPTRDAAEMGRVLPRSGQEASQGLGTVNPVFPVIHPNDERGGGTRARSEPTKQPGRGHGASLAAGLGVRPRSRG